MTDNKIMPKVFGWMFIGLLLTFLTSFFISTREYTTLKIFTGYTPLILAVIEIGLAIYLTARITKMSPVTAKITFLLYSFVSGITLSGIFIAYELSSIIYVFLATCILFGLFAFIGFVTKIDLTKIGTYLIIALIGSIICSVINIFLHNEMMYTLISVVCVIVFVGLTAYDVQKIKQLENSGIIPIENLPIYGALQLYLDFINIFIELLKLFGKSRD